MPQLEAGVLFTVGVTATAVVVWLVRLEGRINLNERITSDLAADITEIKADVKALLKINGRRGTD